MFTLCKSDTICSLIGYSTRDSFLLGVQDVRREERVELGVEVRVFEVVVADEGEDAAEGEHRDHAAHVVRRHQEVGQEEGAGQVGHHLRKVKMELNLIQNWVK